MSQDSLDFGRDHRVTEAHRAVLRIVNDVVDAVGLLPAAGACGCRTSELSDAIAHRGGRYLRIEWVLALLDIAPADFRYRLGSALLNWVGFTPTPLRPLTAAERLAELEQKVVARFGQAGAALVEEQHVPVASRR